MTRTYAATMAGLIATAAIAGGAEPQPEGEAASQPPISTSPPPAEASPAIHGTVITTMNAAGYTYVQVDTGDGRVWAAAPLTELKVGDVVSLPDGVPMPGFYSPTLDRRFDLIYFSSGLEVTGGEAADLPNLGGHCSSGPEDDAEIDLSGIETAEGGKTIAGLFENREGLDGQEVTVRGRVVKCLSKILGRNWIHLRDGTAGPGGADELTITTQETAAVGSTLLVRGTVVVDKDFGHGYKYDLLLEDASITVE